MDKTSGRQDRVVELLDEAVLDLANIDNSTATTWGTAQAERYDEFLTNEMLVLAEDPSLGQRLEQHPDYRSFVAKQNKGRWTHGHRILYREIPAGIEVARILHTAMNWEALLMVLEDT